MFNYEEVGLPTHVTPSELIEDINMQSPDTFKPWVDYAGILGIPTVNFKNMLQGKTILDSGSGLNGFAISAYYDKLPLKIISISPGSVNRHRWVAERNMDQRFIDYCANKDPKRLRSAMDLADKYTLATGSFHMPEVPDESIDIGLDICGAMMYERKTGVYMATAREFYRVLRPGGTFYIDDSSFKKTPWKTKLLHEDGINYELLHDGNLVTGIVINKPNG